MNKIRIFMVMLLMTTLLCSVVSATEQSVTVNIYRTTSDLDDEINISWNKYGESQEILVSEIFNVFGDTIKLIEIANDGDSAFFRFTNKNKDFILGNSDSTSLDEYIYENNKIKLLNINDKTTIETISSDGIPVAVWIEPSIGDKKYLTVNGVNTFNPVDYGSDSGWTTTYEKEEVILYAERLEDVTVAFNMESNGVWEKEENNNMIKYYLKSNTEYKFTIDYTEIGLWGGESDVIDIYMISINGLGESISSTSTSTTTNNDIVDTTTPIVEGNYDINFGNTKNIITDVDGEWTIGNGINVDVNIQGEKYVWTFDFTKAGRYSPEFLSENGERGYVNFNVKDINVNSNANQIQPIDNNNDSAIGKIIFILGIIGLVGIGLYYANNKKKTKMSLANTVKENDESLIE